MILRPLQPAEAFYRFNTPRWSYRPTSGAGAAKVGGRFNRPGVELSIYDPRDDLPRNQDSWRE
jgi:RES domain-containing protein